VQLLQRRRNRIERSIGLTHPGTFLVMIVCHDALLNAV
jgi:hypothetical protein